MSVITRDGDYYLYAEYCPGDLFWGWWLYAGEVPADGEKFDRETSQWIDGDFQRMDIARDLLGLDCPYGEHRNSLSVRIADAFLERFPLGAIVRFRQRGTPRFAVLPEHHDRLPLLHRQRQEQQLLDWKAARERYYRCEDGRINLDEIEARLKAATPGPWVGGHLRSIESETGYNIALVYRYAVNNEDTGQENVALIAHAPTDIAALIAEVRQLRATVDRWQRTAHALASSEVVRAQYHACLDEERAS